MIINTQQLILFGAVFFLALMTGLFFNWANTITTGLARLPDRDYIHAMQVFNRSIQNPLFLVVFLGTAVLLPLSAGMQYAIPGRQRFYWLLAASLIYLTGVMAVTIFGNIPLNRLLEQFHLSQADAAAITAQRKSFEAPWNRLNNLRTVCSVITLIVVLIACFIREKVDTSHTAD
jgi:uncharacterized membrane protein